MKPITLKHVIASAMQCISLMVISPARSQAVLFDFDNAPIHTSLPISLTVSGITAHFAATDQGYSIQDANTLGFTPQGFSGRVIYPNSINLSDLLIKFDSTLTDFSMMYSCQELGCDNAATMRVTAYLKGSLTGTNTKVASVPGTWPVDTLRCTFAQGFDSVVVHYDKRPPTCQDYGTIFLADNMRVTAMAILPVNLKYFTSEARGNEAILQWKSADEINLNSYIVQYSGNGSGFKDLARITAAGSNHAYSFMCSHVNGTEYYRLKMLDQDGAYKYSDIKKLIFGNNTYFTVLPNPSSGYIQISSNIISDLKTVQIFSVDGVLLKTVANYTGKKILMGELPKGTYILKAFSLKGEMLFEKLLLKM